MNTDAVPGQQDILAALRVDGDPVVRKIENTVEYREPPEELVTQLREQSSDFWYQVRACPGCGQYTTRRGLYAAHGAAFGDDGSEHLPPMAGTGGESGVCSLMASVALDANVAAELAANNPHWAEWKGRCYRHELAKRRCPDKCWPDHAEHTATVATRVWGSTAWTTQKWKEMTS